MMHILRYRPQPGLPHTNMRYADASLFNADFRAAVRYTHVISESHHQVLEYWSRNDDHWGIIQSWIYTDAATGAMTARKITQTNTPTACYGKSLPIPERPRSNSHLPMSVPGVTPDPCNMVVGLAYLAAYCGSHGRRYTST